MASWFRVIQPDGFKHNLALNSIEWRLDAIKPVIQRWQKYCQDNWISYNNKDPYTPQDKVKYFLSGLGYYLLIGDTDGVITDYKDIEIGKREIPVTSCPSTITDELYGVVHTGDNPETKEEEKAFWCMIENLSGDKKKSKPRQKQETRFDRIQNARKEYGKLKTTRAIVDTDNIFMFCGKRYKISYTKYQPEETKIGDYYELDYVICAQTPGGGLLFFDPEFYRIPDDAVAAQ